MTDLADNRIQTLRARFNTAAEKRPAYWQQGLRNAHRKGIQLRHGWFQGAWRQRVLDAAQKSPIARQALEWAGAHGIDIDVVRSLKGAHGRYDYNGKIKLRYRPDAKIHKVVDTLVHEIRHAWQDHYGLLYDRQYEQLSLSDKLIVSSLVEADAMAMGRLAALECKYSVDNVDAYLQGGFTRWFKTQVDLYHDGEVTHHLKEARKKLGARLHELFFGKAQPQDKAVIDWRDYVDRLGRKFDGGHYINTSDDLRDFITLKVLPRGRGLRGFGAIKDISPAAVREDKRERMARIRKP